MELQLLVLLFLTDDTPLVLSNPLKYYLILQHKTWDEARAYCRSTYTDLAIIKTAADMNQFQTEAQDHQFSSSAWIGLWNDVNSWRWSLGNQPIGSWTDWSVNFNPLEPNNKGGKQVCGRIYKGSWSDMICTDSTPFICFDDRLTGTDQYIYYPDLKTWPEAQTFCRESHTDLTSSKDSPEKSIIEQKIPSATMYTWMGLYREAWKWTDQTNFSTISWTSGQPDNAQWNENCGYVSDGVVADGPCSDLKPFFCYAETTGQQQIIRMKVQSNQNVNDPAVKAALLKQIKQELKDRGMENVTVKWREQSDGKVFQKIDEDESSSAESTSSSRCDV